MTIEQLSGEINKMKLLLEISAQRYHYDLGHPTVIRISQKLDTLILRYIKQSRIRKG